MGDPEAARHVTKEVTSQELAEPTNPPCSTHTTPRGNQRGNLGSGRHNSKEITTESPPWHRQPEPQAPENTNTQPLAILTCQSRENPHHGPHQRIPMQHGGGHWVIPDHCILEHYQESSSKTRKETVGPQKLVLKYY